MARCEVCGNDYYLSFEVITAGNRHVFDCFECAIHSLAPVCAHCGCRVIGHGIETKDNYFCCANCSRQPELRVLSTMLAKPATSAKEISMRTKTKKEARQ